jgi:hypothetical protein
LTTIESNSATSEDDLYCSDYPDHTYCTVNHQDQGTTEKCGASQGTEGVDPKFPLIAIIGLALGGFGLVLCVIVVALRLLRKDEKEPKLLQRIPGERGSYNEKESVELLADYDD